MAYWLMKSEPDAFSFEQLKALGSNGSEWTGVRNYLARNNMRTMKIGDKVFYYHSNIGLEVVGIAEVCALSHKDSTTEDPRWDCVDVKANPHLSKMALVTSMRLSVQPVTDDEWIEVCRMGGLSPVPK